MKLEGREETYRRKCRKKETRKEGTMESGGGGGKKREEMEEYENGQTEEEEEDEKEKEQTKRKRKPKGDMRLRRASKSSDAPDLPRVGASTPVGSNFHFADNRFVTHQYGWQFMTTTGIETIPSHTMSIESSITENVASDFHDGGLGH